MGRYAQLITPTLIVLSMHMDVVSACNYRDVASLAPSRLFPQICEAMTVHKKVMSTDSRAPVCTY